MSIVTEWEGLCALDLERVRDLMACPVIVDLRNIYRPDDMKKRGFAYVCVGRAASYRPASVYVPSVRAPSMATAEADRLGGEQVEARSDR
jgi:hypothetical protein